MIRLQIAAKCLVALLMFAALMADRSSAQIVRQWNKNVSGDYTDPFSWSPVGIPEAIDTLTFFQGSAVSYTVRFPGRPVLEGTAHYVADSLRVGPNTVFFAESFEPHLGGSTYTLTNPTTTEADRGIIIGQSAGDPESNLVTHLSSLSATAAMIGDAAGATGLLLVERTFNLTGHSTDYELIVGNYGTGALSVVNGGQVNLSGDDGDAVLGNYAGSMGFATVAGAGTTWTSPDNLFVGGGGTGFLRIEAGASVTTGPGGGSTGTGGRIGFRPDAQGTATVSGTGSTWINSGVLIVGVDGMGTLLIEDGGSVSNRRGFIGQGANAHGMASVTGPGSTWIHTEGIGFSGALSVGYNGTGTLTVSNGGNVTNTIGLIGENNSTGSATISGTGSTWANSRQLFVGYFGDGTLTVESGGRVTSNEGLVGDFVNSTGTATITGAGSTWDITFGFWVGYAGTGTLRIEAGGNVISPGGLIGFRPDAEGAVTVTGAGSTWTNSGNLGVGSQGSGTLTIEDGGSVTSDRGSIGSSAGSTGTANITGAGSIWTVSGPFAHLHVGYEGTGTLRIQNGALVSSQDSYVGGGSFSSGTGSGMAVVSGTGSTWTNSGSLVLGDRGSGVLSVQEGAHISTATGFIGRAAGSTAAVTITGAGSTWTNTGDLTVGDAGTGVLIVSDSGIVSVGGTLSVGPLGALKGAGGTIMGNVSNSGTVTPGASAGALTIDGDYTQTPAGQLQIELGGTMPGTDYDQLNVSGVATLAGTLDVDFIAPSPSDTFVILTYGSRTGMFDTVSLPPLPVGLDWSVNYNATNLTLRVISPMLAGDVDGNSVVERNDVALFAPHLGTSVGSVGATGDFDGDGMTTLHDLALQQANLGATLPSPAPAANAVPEPASAFLLACAVAIFTWARAKRK